MWHFFGYYVCANNATNIVIMAKQTCNHWTSACNKHSSICMAALHWLRSNRKASPLIYNIILKSWKPQQSKKKQKLMQMFRKKNLNTKKINGRRKKAWFLKLVFASWNSRKKTWKKWRQQLKLENKFNAEFRHQ